MPLPAQPWPLPVLRSSGWTVLDGSPSAAPTISFQRLFHSLIGASLRNVHFINLNLDLCMNTTHTSKFTPLLPYFQIF